MFKFSVWRIKPFQQIFIQLTKTFLIKTNIQKMPSRTSFLNKNCHPKKRKRGVYDKKAEQ